MYQRSICFASHSKVLQFYFLPLRTGEFYFRAAASPLIQSRRKFLMEVRRNACSHWKPPIHCFLTLHQRNSKSSCWIRVLQGPGFHHPPPTVITHHLHWHHPSPSTTTTPRRSHYSPPAPSQPAPLIKQALCARSCATWVCNHCSIATAVFDMD